MSGSFHQQHVAEIIRASQKEWRDGYNLGKKGGKKKGNPHYRSAAYQDGYNRGWNEFLGIATELPKTYERKRLTPKEIANEQYYRGYYLGEHGEYYTDEFLLKLPASFREGYLRGFADAEIRVCSDESFDEDYYAHYNDPHYDVW